MQLLTPDSLHYPITVTKLLLQPGDTVKTTDPLFTYEYKSRVIEFDDERREDVERMRSFYSEFQSEYEGTIRSLRVQKGNVIEGARVVAEIEEACRHETQYGGICADCGKDMTTVQYTSTTRNTDRATVNTAHANTELRVSLAQASKADEAAKRRLLNSRKLSLVVDLDQTIIHATVDPTVEEWQKDPDNPNYDAVKDVRAFRLVDDAPGARGCWYYIKLRPGLAQFLEHISKHYELHIYTMGTRAYAENIAKIIDPKRSIFGDRILSRDESGSLTAKNLKRLFPVDTKMVVIIDDRGDVWHWSPNLVKVVPYDFFVGIGDINSSFLPKRPELEVKPRRSTIAEPDSTSAEPTAAAAATAASPTDLPSGEPNAPVLAPPRTSDGTSAVDRLVSMAGNQDESSIKVKTDEQDDTIAQQLADRPLLQMQKILDAQEEEAKASPAAEAAAELLSKEDQHDASAPETTLPRYRHNLLQDDDNELEHLQRNLGEIHRLYFDEYDMISAGTKGGRVADMRNGHGKKRPVDDLDSIPDAAVIMTRLKAQVLSGVSIVFSGVIPMGVVIKSHDIAVWAMSFGASVTENVQKRTTHVIASPERRTAKVRQAAKRGGRVQIVSQAWLFACFSQWRKVDETPYRIHTDANGAQPQAATLPDIFDGKDTMPLSSSEEEAAVTEDESDTNSEKTSGLRGLPAPAEPDTDTEELSKYAPTSERADVSPTADEQPDYWADIHDELDAFLASETEASSDDESTRSDLSSNELPRSKDARKRKRGRGPRDTDTESGGESSGEGSRLQKRKKDANARSSGLAQMANVSASPNPQVPVTPSAQMAADTAGDENDTANPAGGDGAKEQDGEELDLEAALAAEMEKLSDVEDGDAGDDASLAIPAPAPG